MCVCIYLPALIDNTLTHSFIRCIYLCLCSISCCFWRPHKHTRTGTKSNTNTSHHSQNHSINKNDSGLHLCVVQWSTQKFAPNAIKSIDSVSSPKLKHISYYYVRSFCFMSQSIHAKHMLKKYEWHSFLLHIHKAIQLFVLQTLCNSMRMICSFGWKLRLWVAKLEMPLHCRQQQHHVL